MNKELKMMGDKKNDVLLIWGEKDPLTPISLSKKYRQEIPHIKFIKVSNAGHLSNYERPDTVNTILIDYLR
jgi:pimeloyl-ACP methyl ester carboxylesterase